MKSCPACHRTFEDTFTFCLVDGAILSAPFDPQAAPSDQVKRNKDSVPTEVLPTNAFDAHSPQTWPSPAPAATVPAYPKDVPVWAVPQVTPQERPSAPGQFLIEPASRRNFLLRYTLMRVLFTAIAIGFWYLLIPLYPANDESGLKYGLLIILRSVVLGVLLGAAQAVILRKWIAATKSWILYTVAAYLLIGVVRFIFFQVLHAWPQPYDDLAVTISEVSVIAATFAGWVFPALIQLLVLHKYVKAAAWWVIVGLACAVIDYATFKLQPWQTLTPLAIAAIDVFMSGFITGIIQASCLLNLRKKPTAVNLA